MTMAIALHLGSLVSSLEHSQDGWGTSDGSRKRGRMRGGHYKPRLEDSPTS